jgi:hypothetical protein
MYANGTGVPEDRDKAEALYRKACDAGDSSSCDALKVASIRPCSNTAKLSLGLVKRQVGKLLGDPILSAMAQCGGAKGVKRWPCETLTYQCTDASGTGARVEVVFGYDQAQSWSVQTVP